MAHETRQAILSLTSNTVVYYVRRWSSLAFCVKESAINKQRTFDEFGYWL